MAKKRFNIFFKTQQKWLFWPIIIIVSLAAIFYILYLNNNFYKEYSAAMEKLSQPPNFGPRSRVYIDFGDGTKRAFEGKVLSGMTIKIIIAAALEAGNLEIIFTKDQKKIAAIGGLANSVHKKWIIYLNDDNKPVESILAMMRPGGKVMLSYK